jgi:hypothetical protein
MTESPNKAPEPTSGAVTPRSVLEHCWFGRMKPRLLHFVVLSLGALFGCTRQQPSNDVLPTSSSSVSEYSQRLVAIKVRYPFARWAKSGLPQYTPRACAAFVTVFDRLIADLSTLGESAPDAKKLDCFRRAVGKLNELNERDTSLIETGEREDLCELLAQIGIAAGMPPSKFPDEEGAASGRDW